MEKYLQISCSIILMMLTFSLNAQTINIPDANFKNALITEGVDTNGDGEIQESEALALIELVVYNAGIVSLEGIQYFKNLQKLDCQGNFITSINIDSLTKLKYLDCEGNQITYLNLENTKELTYLNFSTNHLTTIDLRESKKLTYLNLNLNFLTKLDVSNSTNLKTLICTSNQFTSLDFSNLTLDALYCDENKFLEVLYLKNNNYVSPYDYFIFYDVPKLKYICTDENEVETFRLYAIEAEYPNIIINSLCSSTANGSFYSISGQTKLDLDNNGCDESDTALPFLKVKVSNAIDSTYTISGTDGNFSIHLNSGAYTFQPILENAYYTVSPETSTFTLPDTVSPIFCISPNGVHNDLSVSIIPTRAARPGFSDATYKVVYKNQGTSTQNGSVTFNYDEAKMNFITSSPIANNSTNGNISFDFSGLKPFETGSVIIKMRTNAPTDNPAINSGDVLEFTAVINGSTDETPDDNLAILNQTVVGSVDPNDKTCLEGEIVSPELIGKNVHYLIRFENEGTANAENIVVTDYIDTTVFDINTLQITDASHICHTQISQGNKVQFIFSDIQLPFSEPNKHGHVAFSIKLKDNLVIGDSIQNKADIYFDYNLPVATNKAISEINYKTVTYIGRNNTLQAALDIYPNPSNGQFSLDLKADINSKVQISILNVEGKVVFAREINHQQHSLLPLNLKGLAKGVYLIKAQIENDIFSKKVVIQ
jgi:uncharacterized repeat protein (TIGR01451 family)